MKERIRGRVAGVVLSLTLIGGTIFGSGCAKEAPSISPVTPATASAPGPRPPETPTIKTLVETEWSRLSPLERIDRFELKQYPQIPGFDPDRGLVSAVADFYCQRVKCNRDPRDMKQNTFFVDKDQFVQEVEKDFEQRIGMKLSEGSKQEFRDKKLGITTVDGKIFINNPLLHDSSEMLRIRRPDIVRQLGNRDLQAIILKGTLFHENSHANQSKEKFDIIYPEKPVQLLGLKGDTVEKIEGFVIFAKTADGVPYIIGGGNEAVAEYMGVDIGRETGILIRDGKHEVERHLIDDLNRRGNIDKIGFKEYLTGQKSIRELFKRWGAIKDPINPDEHVGVSAFLVIAWLNEGSISQEEAIKKLNTLFIQ